MTNTEYVSCIIQGGLGNQLFQIASVLEYASTHKKTAVFKNIDFLYNHFNHERRTYWSTLFGGKLNVLSSEEFDKISFTPIYERENNVFRVLPYIGGNVMLYGYFQSYKYISQNTKEKMIDLVHSNEEYVAEAKEIYDDIKRSFNIDDDDDMISMHIRRGDYILCEKYHRNVSNDGYYEKAYDLSCSMSNKQRCVIVFSDDINWCKENIKYDRVFFVDISQGRYRSYVSIEFILMSLFKNNIIANSTFSWFASFVGGDDGKIVFVPRQWFGVKGPKTCVEMFVGNMIVV